jgi:hypothetical protein
MNYKKPDKYMTLTPKSEIEICEKCPYPQPICKSKGCEYFRQAKAKILEERNDKRRLGGKTIKPCGN